MTGYDAGSPAAVVTGAERELAVTHWLMSAAPDPQHARTEWAQTSITHLRCGALFTAVRIPAELVYAAAGASEASAVDAYLARALLGGPVIATAGGRWYYTLVPASTSHRWRDGNGATECLPWGAHLAVPHPGLVEHEAGRSYWAVPMDSLGELCVPAAVSQLVVTGRHRRQCAAQTGLSVPPEVTEAVAYTVAAEELRATVQPGEGSC